MKKIWGIKTQAVLALVLCAGTAHAATLFTPPLVPEGDNRLDCYLVNVGDKTRKVLIQALNAQGTVVAEEPVTLAPSTEFVATSPSEDKPRYCKFVVVGPKNAFRASILVRDDGVGSISALAAQ